MDTVSARLLELEGFGGEDHKFGITTYSPTEHETLLRSNFAGEKEIWSKVTTSSVGTPVNPEIGNGNLPIELQMKAGDTEMEDDEHMFEADCRFSATQNFNHAKQNMLPTQQANIESTESNATDASCAEVQLHSNSSPVEAEAEVFTGADTTSFCERTAKVQSDTHSENNVEETSVSPPKAPSSTLVSPREASDNEAPSPLPPPLPSFAPRAVQSIHDMSYLILHNNSVETHPNEDVTEDDQTISSPKMVPPVKGGSVVAEEVVHLSSMSLQEIGVGVERRVEESKDSLLRGSSSFSSLSLGGE